MAVQNRVNNKNIYLTTGLFLLLVCAIRGGNAVSGLIAFTFLSPLFSVVFGAVILSETQNIQRSGNENT